MVIQRAQAISIFSHPKANLALDILGQDSGHGASSGYHEIQTVFHQLSAPADEIVIEGIEGSAIEVSSDNPELPVDETNTVLKAARLLQKQLSLKQADISGSCNSPAGASPGARIYIKKRIPLMSGLGGGSSNAVATLEGLAQLWKLRCCENFSHNSELRVPRVPRIPRVQHSQNCIFKNLAQQIGMDCAFFFEGGTALGEHFGERVTELPPLPPEIKFEVIETGVKVSSHDAYRLIDLKKCGQNQDRTKKLIEALRARDAKGILENIHNDFEEAIFAARPELQKRAEMERAQLKRAGHADSLIFLAGSGGALIKAGLYL